MFIRCYLRASTKEQDAARAKDTLIKFARGYGHSIATFYEENESGATLARPELMRLIDESHWGDILLVEQVDRLARLNQKDWAALRRMLSEKGIVIVSPELKTSWDVLIKRPAVESSEEEEDSISPVMTARKDYLDRRRRQAQGIEKAKAAGKYQDRKPRSQDVARRAAVRKLLIAGNTYSDIQSALGCSRRLIADVSRQLKDEKALGE